MKAERKSNVAKQPSAYPYSVRDRKPSKRAEAAKEQEDARVLPQKQHAWPDRASRAGKRKASSTLREIRATSPAARSAIAQGHISDSDKQTSQDSQQLPPSKRQKREAEGLKHPSDEKFAEDLVHDLVSHYRAGKEAWAKSDSSEQNEESISIGGESCEDKIKQAVQNYLEQQEGRQIEAEVTPTDDESAAAATMLDLAAGPAKEETLAVARPQEEMPTGDTSTEEALHNKASRFEEESAAASTQTEAPKTSPSPPADSPAATPNQAQDSDKEKNDISTTEPGIPCPHLWRVKGKKHAGTKKQVNHLAQMRKIDRETRELEGKSDEKMTAWVAKQEEKDRKAFGNWATTKGPKREFPSHFGLEPWAATLNGFGDLDMHRRCSPPIERKDSNSEPETPPSSSSSQTVASRVGTRTRAKPTRLSSYY